MILRLASERGIGKCIQIMCDEENAHIQEEILVDKIGTVRVSLASYTPMIRCAFSVENLRKIRISFPDVRLDKSDPVTVSMMDQLIEMKDAYDASGRAGDRAKEGNLAGPSDYRFKMSPFAHQRVGWNFLHAVDNPALFGQCGIGKTYIAATWADSIIKSGAKMVFLVVCPVSIIEHAWMCDIEKFSDLTATRLHEPSQYKKKEKVARRFAQDSDVYVINPESMIRVEGDLIKLIKRRAKEGFELALILDESSKVKSRTSATFKALRTIRAYAKKTVIMTGTPAPNGIKDLWAQFYILDLGMTLQPNYVDYRHDTHVNFTMPGVGRMIRGTYSPIVHWRPRSGIEKKVYSDIKQHMIRFRAADCLDLPSKQFLRRDVAMTKEQTKAYNEMRDYLFTEIDESGVTAKVAALRLMKLRQITGGFVIDDNGIARQINKNPPKMLELDTLLEQAVGKKLGDEGVAPTKAIVWGQYRWECNTLLTRYERYGARGLFGGISQTKRDDNIRAFMNDDSCTVLVCHPQAAGHGLTLTAANYAFYYSLSHNWDEFYQSAHRIARPGQDKPMFFYFLVSPKTVDEVIIKALQDKTSVSSIVTDGPFRKDILDSIQIPDKQTLSITLED